MQLPRLVLSMALGATVGFVMSLSFTGWTGVLAALVFSAVATSIISTILLSSKEEKQDELNKFWNRE